MVIDAGANIDLFSLLIARAQPVCRVLAFEPFQENYALLMDNLASAGAASVQAFRMAPSGEAMIGTMIDGGGRSQDHKLEASAVGESDPSAVPMCDFAAAFPMAPPGPVALLECDIEGGEYNLSRRAADEDLRRVRRYAIEYHDNIRPGTSELLRQRLGATHELVVHLRSTRGCTARQTTPCPKGNEFLRGNSSEVISDPTRFGPAIRDAILEPQDRPLDEVPGQHSNGKSQGGQEEGFGGRIVYSEADGQAVASNEDRVVVQVQAVTDRSQVDQRLRAKHRHAPTATRYGNNGHYTRRGVE